MSSKFTPLNVEQSVAEYFKDELLTAGYKVLWYDTRQTEGSGSVTVTILRDFPPTATNFARQSATDKEGIIRVPAFAVFSNMPKTSDIDRMGLGEGAFEWRMDLRIDGFLDTQLQWYQFQTFFKDRFNPDTRVTLYDYEADINSDSPTSESETIRFQNTDIFRQELDEKPAARYYVNMTSTAVFIE